MPSLDRLANLVDPDKVMVVGVSVDDDDHLVREFLIERKIFFHNLLDLHMKQAGPLIGIRSYPTTFYIGPDGVLLRIEEGWKIWDTQEVIKEIRALSQTKP